MGSWRLKPVVSPLIEFLVAHVEGAWRHLIDELGLFPLPPVEPIDQKMPLLLYLHSITCLPCTSIATVCAHFLPVGLLFDREV